MILYGEIMRFAREEPADEDPVDEVNEGMTKSLNADARTGVMRPRAAERTEMLFGM